MGQRECCATQLAFACSSLVAQRFLLLAPSRFSSAKTQGKSSKLIRIENDMAIIIIQPKLITGWMSVNSSEAKPIEVVIPAYKHGCTLRAKVSTTNRCCSQSGWSLQYSRYCTIK